MADKLSRWCGLSVKEDDGGLKVLCRSCSRKIANIEDRVSSLQSLGVRSGGAVVHSPQSPEFASTVSVRRSRSPQAGTLTTCTPKRPTPVRRSRSTVERSPSGCTPSAKARRLASDVWPFRGSWSGFEQPVPFFFSTERFNDVASILQAGRTERPRPQLGCHRLQPFTAIEKKS